MDFRTPRPADRTPLSRPRPAQHQAAESQPASEAPKTTYRTPMPQEKKPSKRFKLPIIIVAIVVLAAAGWFWWSNARTAGTAIDSSKYQAVFFTNGEFYFGKLHPFNAEYMKLTDIYYLQKQSDGKADADNPQKTTDEQNNVQLIKLGDEIHGPEDEMVISKDQILFYENLKTNSKVAESIQKFKDANN